MSANRRGGMERLSGHGIPVMEVKELAKMGAIVNTLPDASIPALRALALPQRGAIPRERRQISSKRCSGRSAGPAQQSSPVGLLPLESMTAPVSTAVTVVIPSHNPHLGRLRETLRGLRIQSLANDAWETLLVDNASSAFPADADYADSAPPNLRALRESRIGLTSARLAGIRAARGAAIVLVDDDNVLAPDYLAEVARLFARDSRLGAAGGKSLPVFESPPAPWQNEFLSLLAVRDLGETELLATSFRPAGAAQDPYPLCAPIGAGMALRREAALEWAAGAERDPNRRRLDRTGLDLASGGDNDIVMAVLEHGWSVGYFPSLSLSHMIPSARLDPRYMARLNRAIQRSWIQVLAAHNANPWAPIARWTVAPRKLKAWFANRAWKGPASQIRWQGACGHFEGRAAIPRC